MQPRREAALEQVATDIRRSGGSALPLVTDLARDRSLANLVAQTRAELGPIDILVNNAGYAMWKSLEAAMLVAALLARRRGVLIGGPGRNLGRDAVAHVGRIRRVDTGGDKETHGHCREEVGARADPL